MAPKLAATTRITSAAIARVSLARSPRGKWNLLTIDKSIPDRAQSLDRRRSAVRRKLTAQVADVDLDHVSSRVEVITPHGAQDLLLGKHLARVTHEVGEQLELAGGERDRHAAALHSPREEVEPDAGHRELGGAALLGTPQVRAHARGQLV